MQRRLIKVCIGALLCALMVPAVAYADVVERTLDGTGSYEDTDGTIKLCTTDFMFFVYDNNGNLIGEGGFRDDGSMDTLPFDAETGIYYLILLDSTGRVLPSYAWYAIEIQEPTTDLGSFVFKRIDTVTLTINKDDALWTNNPFSGSFLLKRVGSGFPSEYSTTEIGSPVHFYGVFDGTYSLYAGSLDTGIAVIIKGADSPAVQPQTLQLNYYSLVYKLAHSDVALGVTLRATYDSTPVASGSVVLGGKELVLTVIPPDAQSYTYAWRGEGTSGQTEASITVSALAQAVDAVCTLGLESATGGSTTHPPRSDRLPNAGDATVFLIVVLAVAAGGALMVLLIQRKTVRSGYTRSTARNRTKA